MNVPTTASRSDAQNLLTRNAIETVIRVGAVLLLAVWCFDLVKPFIGIIAWALVIAIAVEPAYDRLKPKLGGSSTLASVLLTGGLLLALAAPTFMLVETLVSGSRDLAHELSDGSIQIPPPPAKLSERPVFGQPVADAWSLASENLGELLADFKPQLKSLSAWLLAATAKTGFAILTFMLAVLISGVLLVNADKRDRASELVFARLAGDSGNRYLSLSRSTIRSVAQGILGVALFQSTLAGLGFLVAGIPGAGVLAVVTLFLCVVQLGPTLVLLPTVIYMFAVAEPVAAFVYLGWSILVALVDNVLKPLLLGRGVDVPVLVVFLGAIGGFLSMGIIGLFVGSIVLVLGYTLLLEWLHTETGDAPGVAVAEASVPAGDDGA